jgi:hypothetical protein
MNAYTTRGRARIRQSDLANVLGADPHTAAASLRALEWRRGCQAEAELNWLLKQHGIGTQPASSPISTLRQAIGAALVWAGERLGGSPRQEKTPDVIPAPGTLGTVG